MNFIENDLKYFNQIMNILDKYKNVIDKMDYNMLDEYIKLSFIALNGNNIKFIDNPNYKMCINSIKKNPEALMWINEPTEEMVLEAINLSPVCIQLSNKLYINCIYRVLEIDKELISLIKDMANIYKSTNIENFRILDKIIKEFKY